MTELDAPPEPELILWAGSVRWLMLTERTRAARAGGFTSVSIFPFDVAAAEGLDAAGVREWHDLHALRIAVVDPLTTWLPGSTVPNGLEPTDPAYGGIDADGILGLADALGAGMITALALYDDLVEAGAGASAFRGLCDRAAERGVAVGLEFVPGTGIPDLALAWEIVRRADRPNGGLVLDTWHLFRSGSDPQSLRQIPTERIFAVQLADAPVAPPADLAHESLHERLMPGEGELDLEGALGAVLAGGTPPLIGPEVFSDRSRYAPPQWLGRLLGDRTRELLAACKQG
jgi:sugar phosphate isomerase/epimerase